MGQAGASTHYSARQLLPVYRRQWIYKVNTSKTKAVRVPLSIGRQNPQQYEIVEGLQPGDWVITTGYDTFGDAEELF